MRAICTKIVESSADNPIAPANIIAGAIQPAIIAITCCRASGIESLFDTSASYLNKFLYVLVIFTSLLIMANSHLDIKAAN